LFDWVILQTEGPAGAVPEKALATLLNAKLEGIDTALSHMAQRQSQRLAWERIRTHHLPDFDWATQWAKARLTQWSQLEHPPRLPPSA
jgi:hypothetical protein